MARLKHPEEGTEIEVPDHMAARYAARGWKAVDSGEPRDNKRRRSPSRKAAES